MQHNATFELPDSADHPVNAINPYLEILPNRVTICVPSNNSYSKDLS
jgi:hypothetical protein